jgi:hypothetical protein
MTADLAYLSRGKMHIKRGIAPPELLESKFGETVRQRAVEIHRRHAWKTEGRGAAFMSGAAMWGLGNREPAEMPILVTGFSSGCREGQLLYTLHTPDISGIFVLREGDYFEQRLFHSADQRVAQVSARPGLDLIAFVLRHKGGEASLGVLSERGTDFAEITQGDSIDEFPRWVPGKPGTIVFQSAGIGRDARGAFAARGPYSIQQIDLESGEMKCLAEDEKYDFLSPQISEDGALYYIRRPYKSPRARVSPSRAFVDMVMFPFRLLNAVFHYLNFFSMIYSGKPLKSSGNARAKEMDMRRFMLMGNYASALELLKHSEDSDTPAVVPPNWELVRSRSGGAADREVLAKNVLSYDLQADGAIVYSNGSSIYRLDPTGKSDLMFKGDLIEHVVAVQLVAPPS